MKSIQSLLKKYDSLSVVAKATLWFVFASTLQKAISVVTTPIFTRLMLPEQYGQVSAYNSWLETLTILTTLRLNWVVFNKGMSKFKDGRDDYTSTMQTITASLAGLLMVIYLLFRRQFNALTELPTMIMVAMIAELFVTPATSFWTLRKRYEYQYKQVVLRTVSMVVLSALLGIAAVLVTEQKGYARIFSIILVNMSFGVPIFIYNRRRASTWFRPEYAIFALSFNLKLLLHYISQYILDQFDRIMIQKMVGFAETAIYSVAYNAGMLLKILTQSINSALVPWMYSRLEKNEFHELDDMLFKAYLVVAAVVLAFISFAPEVMMVLADQRFQEGIYVVPPVALGMFFLFVYTTIANVEFFYERTRFTSIISMAGAALNVVLNYVGIQMFGYIAAAYTTLICYIFFSISHYAYTIFYVKRLLHLQRIFNIRRIVLLSAGLLFVGLLIILFYDRILLRYLVLAALLLVGYRNREQLMSSFKMVKSAKKKS